MSNDTKTTAGYARRYTKRFGFHLVPIEPGRKFPRSKNWGNTAISDPGIAEAFYNSRPDWNMGLALGPSRMCSLDIDHMPSFELICEAFGIDLPALIADTPTIQGRAPGMRLMFRVPEGVQLPYSKIHWRPESDPTGELHRDLTRQAREMAADGQTEQAEQLRAEAKQHAMYTVFELRAADDEHQRQDVLPPSIHPDTGQPYRWVTQPRLDWPEPPAWLLQLWQDPDRYRPQLMAACPWVVLEEVYKPTLKPKTPTYNGERGFVQAVREYNHKTDISRALESYGYVLKGRRYLSPHSSTRLPGVLLMGENKCWIHHASDPLCSEDTGRPVSPFDLFCYYDHNGDFTAAARAACDMFGISTHAAKQGPAQQRTAGPVAQAAQVEAPRPAVDYTTALPWLSPQNKPLKHHANLAEVLNRLGVIARYNVIKKEHELLIPGQGFSIDNQAEASVAWLRSQCSCFGLSPEAVTEFLTLISDANPYNPVESWIRYKPWDGKPRLAELIDTIETEPQHRELKETLITRWMVAAVAAALASEGLSSRGVLVFQGEQQMGKTMWFKRLAPAHLGVIQDGVLLRPDDRDSVKQAVSNWLVELGELDATFKKSDIAQLKGFLTLQRDVLRLPYARGYSTLPRRTVFFGSVNPREFLNDPTGNTRFWTIPCTAINFRHEIDMQQCWAEVLHLYEQGVPYNLTPEETALLNESNSDYAAIDPIEERILHKLDWDVHRELWQWHQVTDILLAVGVDRPGRSDATKAAAVVRRLNGGASKRTASKRLVLVPPLGTI